MPDMKHYILDENHRVRAVGMMAWARWFGENHQTDLRIVGFTGSTTLYVSTVFTGLDHRFWGKGPPILFETMVFRDGVSGEMERYCCWDDAATGHQAMVRKIFPALEELDARSRK